MTGRLYSLYKVLVSNAMRGELIYIDKGCRRQEIVGLGFREREMVGVREQGHDPTRERWRHLLSWMTPRGLLSAARGSPNAVTDGPGQTAE
jgi:hypothetical protein